MSRYPRKPPRPWVIPTVVSAAVVLGVVSVPLMIGSGMLASVPHALTTSSPGSKSAAAAAAALSPAHRRSAGTAGQLASQPPAGNGSTAGPNTRSAGLQELSGPPGAKVVVTGHCLPGQDDEAQAGIGGLGAAGAVTRQINGSGSFSLTLRAPGSKGDVAVTAACLNQGQVTANWHLVFKVAGSASSPATTAATTTPTGTPTSSPSGSSSSPTSSSPTSSSPTSTRNSTTSSSSTSSTTVNGT